jgi:hypothetical protein
LKISRKRLVLATILLLPLVLAMLVLSRSPTTAASPTPSVREVEAARSLYGKVRGERESPGPRPVEASWAELDAVAGMGGRALGFDRVRFVRDGRRGQLRASIPVGLGFWVNVRGYVEPGRKGELRVHGHLGRLPVPAFLANGVIALSRQILRLRGAEVPSLRQMVQQFSLGDAGLAANLDLPRRSRLMSTLSGLQSDSIEPTRVAGHYCRLIENQKTAPSEDLVEQVRRAFAGGDGTAADNRSVFVALSLLVAGMDAGSLPEGAGPLRQSCGTSPVPIRLLGREDLAKHWAVSGALTAALGTHASLSLGTWKEISDSASGGSGFSLVDLAADRSGTFCAQHGAEGASAMQVRQWLETVTEADLLPLSALALAEGLTEAEFRSRYASTDSSEYAATVARIDASLAVLIHFQRR